MNQKLRLQRLNQLYANIDLPAYQPAAQSLEIHQEAENLPFQVEGQSLEAILLPEMNQMGFAGSHETAGVLGVSTLSMMAPTITAPITSEAGMNITRQGKRPIDQSLETNEPRQADWKAIGIGLITGSTVSGIILVATLQMHIFNTPGRLALWGGEMFLGIIGALIANAGRSTSRELWRAAIEWTFIPILLTLLIAFIFLLLTFTSLNG